MAIKKQFVKTKPVCKVAFSVEAKEANHASVVGDFNNWNAAAQELKFYKQPGLFKTVINLSAGTHAFKFTRGNWETVQVSNKGVDVANNIITVNADTSISFIIADWKDNFLATPKLHTASPNVIMSQVMRGSSTPHSSSG